MGVPSQPQRVKAAASRMWQEGELTAAQIGERLGVTGNVIIGLAKADRVAFPFKASKTIKRHLAAKSAVDVMRFGRQMPRYKSEVEFAEWCIRVRPGEHGVSLSAGMHPA